jgi:two-component system chemotaxis response regulator CheY
MAKRIMTVDDSASVRQMVAFTLKKEGYDVVEASDGKDALSKLSGTVDMVITDLNMPGMNGIELIKEVRKLPACKFMPILFLTTESQQARKAEAKAAGASGWIVKPATADELLNTIKLVLR